MARALHPKMALARRGLAAFAALCAVACSNDSGFGREGAEGPGGSQGHSSSTTGRDASTDTERTPSLPELVTATRVVLGEFASGEVFSLTVPPDTVGVSLVAEGSEGSARFETVKSPSGSLVLSNGKISGSSGIAQHDLEARVATTAIPLHAISSNALESGVWSISLKVNSPSRWRVRAILQTIPGGTYVGSALDIHIFIPDGTTISDPAVKHTLCAANAFTDGSMQFRLDLFFEALKQWFDIDRGTIVFHDMPQGSLEDYASGEPNAQALSLVFSNHNTAGVTVPRSPAAIGFSDTNLMNVLVQHVDSQAESDVLAMLQGFGRTVGLPYTTDDALEDPYPDTPTCPSTTKREDCPDANNLMFRWLTNPKPIVASSQVRVVTRSPLLRAYLPRSGSTTKPPSDPQSASGTHNLPVQTAPSRPATQ